MGSPVSSVAELVMQHLEEQVLNVESLDVIFYFWYVDDTLVCFNKNKVNILKVFDKKGYLKFPKNQ